MSMRRRESLTAYLSLAPAFLLVAVLMWYPLSLAVYRSFTVWDGVSATWVGLANYVDIFTTGQFWLLLRNNLIFLASIPGILIVSLVVSVLLFEQVPGWKFFRSVYYLPTVLSAVVVGLLMRTLFASDGGVNAMLEAVGLGALARDWLGSVPTAFVVLIFAFYWQTLGQGVLVFLAGLSAVSPELLEAAEVEGASWWQRLTLIIMPLLRPAIAFFVVTNVVYIFIGLFSLVYAVTQGGPGYGTMPIDYMIYVRAFQSNQFGYASALSVVLLVMVSVIARYQIKRFEETEAG
jgi:ABC-type sugar transport system permease subunit